MMLITLRTATSDARPRRPKAVIMITEKIVAKTGVPVRFQTYARRRLSGNAFYAKRLINSFPCGDKLAYILRLAILHRYL